MAIQVIELNQGAIKIGALKSAKSDSPNEVLERVVKGCFR